MTSLLGRLAPGLSSKLVLFLDVALLLAAVLLSTDASALGTPELLWAMCSAAFVWLFVSAALRYYDPFADRDYLDDAALASVLVMAVTTVLAVSDLMLGASPNLPHVGAFLVVFWPLAVVVRYFCFRPLSIQEVPMVDVLVVGVASLGRVTGEDLMRRRHRVIGFLAFPDEHVRATLCAPFLGTVRELERTLRSHAVTEVYLAGNPLRQGEAMQNAIRVCERYGVPFALPVHGFRMERAHAMNGQAIRDGYIHYLTVHAKPYQRAVKRLLDIVLSAAALWILSPVLVVVAVAIKLTSRGPVFFKQVRVGLHGRPFHMLKFRSMVVNAEQLKAQLAMKNEQTGPVFKMKKDPRVTAIGRFIRKYSIDELPQLLNILRGDMSIVGPRPPVPDEVAKYEPWQRRRLSVRPGLTCTWQVSGRNKIGFKDWMYLDMQYIDHWSLSQDFSLILKTVPVVLMGKGAS